MKRILFIYLVFIYVVSYGQVSINNDLGIITIYISNDNYNYNKTQIDSILKTDKELEKKIGTLIISGSIKKLPSYIKKIDFIGELIIFNIEGRILKIDTSFNVLKNIEHLRIEGKIDYITDTLCYPKLESIEIVNSTLKIFPKFILKSNQLKEIYLSYNKIKILPNNLFTIKSLEILSIYEKNINSLPKTICVSNLKELIITDELFENINPQIKQCIKNKEIKITTKKFIPDNPNLQQE